MLKIATVGDNCIDVYTNLRQGFPGGGAVNLAVQARRAGVATAYVGVIGDDEFGDWMADALAAEGVETRYLQRVPGPTARAFVRLVDAERTFVGSDHGVRAQLRITAEIDEYLAQFDLVHTTLDGGVDEHIQAWHQAGLKISYDFSHRAKPTRLALLPHVHIAFFSGQHLGEASLHSALAEYHRKSGGLVVMTRGAWGSIAYDGRHEFCQSALPVRVVDTLGAGDAFQAGFVVEYLRTGSIGAALQAGASRAADACGHFGAFSHGHPLALTDVCPGEPCDCQGA